MELLKRADRGDLEGVRTLIAQHVCVNTTNRWNETALYYACKYGHTEVAQYLLDNGASVNLGANPLIAAVRNGHNACVHLLLQHHADVNCTSNQESPMSVALKHNDCSIILLLLQYGATATVSLDDIAVRLLQQAKPEHSQAIHRLIDDVVISLTSVNIFREAFSYCFRCGSPEFAERMLSNDTYLKSDQLHSAAHYSVKNNWPALLSKLFALGIDVNQQVHGQTLLYVACDENHKNVVTLLLNNGANPNEPNKIEYSIFLPLQIAIRRRNAAICNLLLEKGAKVDLPGSHLLHLACTCAGTYDKSDKATETTDSERTLSAVKLLLRQGVNVNAVSDDTGETPLYLACKGQQVEVAEILLEAGADVNLSSRGLRPLVTACEAGNVQLINMLLKAGADMKCSNAENKTCLHAIIDGYSSATESQNSADRVCEFDILGFVNSLIEVGVDVNAYSPGGTALYRASKAGCVDIVRLLLKAGADVNDSNRCNALHVACEHGHAQIVDLLLQHGADSNAPSTSSGNRSIRSMSTSSSSLPICCAAMKGYSDIIDLLLTNGADVNKHDSSDKSALIHFVEFLTADKRVTSQISSQKLPEDHVDTLKSLLLAGGDVNANSRFHGFNALHIASSSGLCDSMTELILHGANCKQLTRGGQSALDLACEKGHEEAVKLLLENGAKPDSSRSENYSYGSYQTAKPVLCTAAKSGSETMVKILLAHGADVALSDQKGDTALHLATSNSAAVVEALLNAGAKVDAKNNKGETALNIICKQGKADTNIVELLLKFGADPNADFELYAACENNNVDIVRLLLAYGADANLEKKSISQRHFAAGLMLFGHPVLAQVIKPSPLCIACRHGNTSMVDHLLKNGAVAAFCDSDGNTALHFAIARLGKQENLAEYDPIVTQLLQRNAPVNVVSARGESPLYVACMNGLAGVAKQLLDCRADMGLTTNNSKKYPLIIACEMKFRDVAVMLLDRGTDPNVSKEEQTPLKLAAANGDDILVKQLLACGADVNQMQNVDDTALHVAVIPRNRLDDGAFANVVQRLLKNGTHLNAVNRSGETPLCLACSPDNDNSDVDLRIVQILLGHGADPNICPPCSLSPLSSAALYQNSELAMLLIKFGAKPDHWDVYRRAAALHLAVADNHYLHFYDNIRPGMLANRLESIERSMSTAETLLLAGADVNVMDTSGVSPLYLACKAGETELAKLLLRFGANPNVSTNKDNYPILAACRNRQCCDIVKLLLSNNADLAVCDTNGKTCLHHALECAYDDDSNTVPEMIRLLLDRGADSNVSSTFGETPFYFACLGGLARVVAMMLECGAKVDGVSAKRVPLIAACQRKRVTVVQLLVTSGANPNILGEGYHPYDHNKSPLHTAAAADDNASVELLLKHGASVDIADAEGNTALHVCVKKYKSMMDLKEVEDTTKSKSVVEILLENGADVNVTNNNGETPLYTAVSRGLLNVVCKMLQDCGGNPSKASSEKNPLVAACEIRSVELVDMLLQHGADPNITSTRYDYATSQCRLPLFVAVEKGNCNEIIRLLIKAGVNVNTTNDEGKNVLCFAAEGVAKLAHYYLSNTEMMNKISTIRLLLEHGTDLNTAMSDGRTLLDIVLTGIGALPVGLREDERRTQLEKLLHMVVNCGAILLDSTSRLGDIHPQLPRDGTLRALVAFDCDQSFIADLFRAGAGFQLLKLCCQAIRPQEARLTPVKSLGLCQAVILAGYSPSAEEMQNLQSEAGGESAVGGLLEQLVNWLNDDKQQVPSLLRQCRVVIRQRLSEVVQYRTILPSIDELPLPNIMKLYLRFEGIKTEVDPGIKEEQQSREVDLERGQDHNSSDLSDYDYSYTNDDSDDYDFDRYYSSDDDSYRGYGRYDPFDLIFGGW